MLGSESPSLSSGDFIIQTDALHNGRRRGGGEEIDRRGSCFWGQTDRFTLALSQVCPRLLSQPSGKMWLVTIEQRVSLAPTGHLGPLSVRGVLDPQAG